MQTGVHTNAVKAVRSILHTHGIGGLYTGYFSMIAREVRVLLSSTNRLIFTHSIDPILIDSVPALGRFKDAMGRVSKCAERVAFSRSVVRIRRWNVCSCRHDAIRCD